MSTPPMPTRKQTPLKGCGISYLEYSSRLTTKLLNQTGIKWPRSCIQLLVNQSTSTSTKWFLRKFWMCSHANTCRFISAVLPSLQRFSLFCREKNVLNFILFYFTNNNEYIDMNGFIFLDLTRLKRSICLKCLVFASRLVSSNLITDFEGVGNVNSFRRRTTNRCQMKCYDNSSLNAGGLEQNCTALWFCLLLLNNLFYFSI